MSALLEKAAAMLGESADQFQADNPHLVFIGGGIEYGEDYVSLQHVYDGAHTLTLTVDVEYLTQDAARARMRRCFYDEGLKKMETTRLTGYFYQTLAGWQFSSGPNKQVKESIEAAKAFEALGGL